MSLCRRVTTLLRTLSPLSTRQIARALEQLYGPDYPRLLYEMADDGLIHRASRFTWELKENA